MVQQAAPFNVSLLTPQGTTVSRLRPVSVLDTYDASGINFHDDGLFSIKTFGQVGSKGRDSTFSYIDLRTHIFHPEVFLTLKSLRSLYPAIIAGTKYAIFDEKTGDFEPSDEAKGDTGYSFFMKHFKQLKLPRNNSDIRNEKINFIEKYQQQATLTKYLVLPAGMRDVEQDHNGRLTEDEINELYRRLLMSANTIVSLDENANSPIIDTARWSLQRIAVDIYLYIKKMISGKRGWIQNKWAARRIMYGTRNVFTSMDISSLDLESPDATEITDSHIGLLQVLRSILPKTIHGLKSGFIGRTFSDENEQVYLTNKKTLLQEPVNLDPEVMELYTTKAGLERLINRFFIEELRNKPIYVGNHYLGLMYIDDKSVKLFKSIDELPEDLSKDNVSPITLSALMYVSSYQHMAKMVGTITRYPVTGSGSDFPTFFKVKTTQSASVKYERQDDWSIDESMQYRMPVFPDQSPNAKWFAGIAVPASRLGGLGADFDGDTGSSPIALTDNVVEEVEAYYNKRSTYIDASGKLAISAQSDVVSLTVANMTTV